MQGKLNTIGQVHRGEFTKYKARLMLIQFNFENQKPNDYRVKDRHWLYDKIESRVSNWCYRGLSRGGK